ncbi:hypothetical protein DPMN_051059 [Dreissena polymorpha]|uniref:Uncharacterized protein n=1 Tax=Dreissena polymorpha TaxID=45954 RepID=A0A9D4CH81_DREPO|nr:hypothetical protein DPMN_051059 [Dreissena polymorpha]
MAPCAFNYSRFQTIGNENGNYDTPDEINDNQRTEFNAKETENISTSEDEISPGNQRSETTLSENVYNTMNNKSDYFYYLFYNNCENKIPEIEIYFIAYDKSHEQIEIDRIMLRVIPSLCSGPVCAIYALQTDTGGIRMVMMNDIIEGHSVRPYRKQDNEIVKKVITRLIKSNTDIEPSDLLADIPGMKVHVIRAEVFEDALRKCYGETMKLAYTNSHPPGCCYVILIPTFVGSFIWKSDNMKDKNHSLDDNANLYWNAMSVKKN